MRRHIFFAGLAVMLLGAGGAAVTGRMAQAQAVPPAGVKFFFVALDDKGKSGREIGCGDSVVAVDRRLTSAATPEAALRDLLSLHDRMYGQSGLYNALAASSLEVERLSITDGVADVQLRGVLTLGGVCDGPRVEAQFAELIRQFPPVSRVAVSVNGTPLEELISGR